MMLDILYCIAALFYFPLLLVRGKWHGGFRQRLGFFPKPLAQELAARENIWVHAVSVGEVALVEGVIKGLQQRHPGLRIVLSVTTKTGHAFALKKYAPSGVCVIWSPLDISAAVRSFVAVIRPKMYVVAETELWPHLFSCLEAAGTPIFLVNGRISDASYGRYRLMRPWVEAMLRQIRLLCVQSRLDADRFIELGALSAHVKIVGNVKFDVMLPAIPLDGAGSKKAFGLEDGEKLFIAASTHPGEEAVVCDAFLALKAEFARLRLAIVPRHPERAKEVSSVVKNRGMEPVLWTQANGRRLGPHDVLVMDAVGYLIDLYRAADVVFVGKSLGIPRRGGQNPIEPAAFGRPVIVGPHMENFRDVMRLFTEAGAMIVISKSEDLAGAVTDVLAHPQRMAGLSVRARTVVDQNRGAAERSVDLMMEAL